MSESPTATEPAVLETEMSAGDCPPVAAPASSVENGVAEKETSLLKSLIAAESLPVSPAKPPVVITVPVSSVLPLPLPVPVQVSAPIPPAAPKHIKRPMNAFMVWAHVRRRQMSVDSPKMHHSNISKILGAEWKMMGPEEKRVYVEEAQKIHNTHMADHPDYKYRPQRRVRAMKKKCPLPISMHNPRTYSVIGQAAQMPFEVPIIGVTSVRAFSMDEYAEYEKRYKAKQNPQVGPVNGPPIAPVPPKQNIFARKPPRPAVQLQPKKNQRVGHAYGPPPIILAPQHVIARPASVPAAKSQLPAPRSINAFKGVPALPGTTSFQKTINGIPGPLSIPRRGPLVATPSPLTVKVYRNQGGFSMTAPNGSAKRPRLESLKLDAPDQEDVTFRPWENKKRRLESGDKDEPVKKPVPEKFNVGARIVREIYENMNLSQYLR